MTFAGAFPTEIDRQGRVLLPPSLRNYADLIDEVVIAGTGRFLEIWSKVAWDVERASIDAYGSKIAEDASVAE
jgi:MraZ protein